MDTTSDLELAAADLERLARELFEVTRGQSGMPTEKPTHDLARSVAYWMIALRRLDRSGPPAWAYIDSQFPRDADEPPPDERFYVAQRFVLGPESETPGELAIMVAELDAATAFLTGDLVLDALAYAELVRRGKVPIWTPGDRVPAMWPRFMTVLDADVSDPMTADVRYLDVTLAIARDVLVAHRDPTIWHLPGFSSQGEVTLSWIPPDSPVEPERKKEALARLHEVIKRLDYAELPQPALLRGGYSGLLINLIMISGHLDRHARAGIRAAMKLVGFEGPSLLPMIERAIRLVRRHRDLSASDPSRLNR